MSYSLKSVTIRTDNSESGMAKINELWADIMTGKIPLEFIENGVPVKGLSPISSYSDYESDEKGKYNLSVMTVTAAFFAKMEELVAQRKYIKIDESGETITDCANKAWSKVWQLTASGEIKRAFTIDYESTVPTEYTKDGKAHCYLYIAIK
ncbi:MAG: AraC family transcriptional regulator [Clostridia bacterium]|jgi:predicted transcriptional regulator YdeE|nr:AraC family transcriptional regulator [Clostridia bacterium]